MQRRGSTLIETLVAVGLAALLARTATVTASSLAGALRLASSARTLAQTMRETRGRAMAEGVPLDVVFDSTNGSWSIRTLDGTLRHTESLPSPVRFLALPARSRIRFESTGTADNGTITLGTGAAARRIVVNQRGRVRLG